MSKDSAQEIFELMQEDETREILYTIDYRNCVVILCHECGQRTYNLSYGEFLKLLYKMHNES